MRNPPKGFGDSRELKGDATSIPGFDVSWTGSPWDKDNPEDERIREKYNRLDLNDPNTIPDLLDMLEHSDANVRASAAGVLGYIGPVNDKIIPALAKAIGDENTRVRVQAGKSLARIGEKALPALKDALKSDNGNAHETAVRAIHLMESDTADTVPIYIEALQDSNNMARVAAAQALGELGEKGYPAIPALIETLEDDDMWVRVIAARALANYGSAASEALPALVRAVFDVYPDMRAQVKTTLQQIDPEALDEISALNKKLGLGDIFGPKYANQTITGLTLENDKDVKNLTNALKDKSYIKRWMAADILRRAAKYAAGAVPALVEALSDDDSWLRQFAADALGEIGPAAADAISVLKEMANNTEELDRVRRSALLAAARIEGGQAIVGLLSNSDTWVRKNAALALAMAKPEGIDVAGELNNLLSDESWQVRDAASLSLKYIGIETEDSVKLLFDELKSTDNAKRQFAGERLGKIGSKAIPGVIEALKDNRTEVREAAAQAFVWMGREAKGATSALIDALDDSSANVRFRSAQSLGNIGPDAITAKAALIKMLTDDASIARYHAARSLGLLGTGAIEAVPALLTALKDRDAEVRIGAAQSLHRLDPTQVDAVGFLINEMKTAQFDAGTAALALAELGPDARRAIPYMIELLGLEDRSARMAAAEALGLFGPDAAEAVPALIKALNDSQEWVRMRAARSLGQIGPAASAAIPKLTDISQKDNFDYVRQAASEAINRIEAPTLNTSNPNAEE